MWRPQKLLPWGFRTLDAAPLRPPPCASITATKRARDMSFILRQIGNESGYIPGVLGYAWRDLEEGAAVAYTCVADSFAASSRSLEQTWRSLDGTTPRLGAFLSETRRAYYVAAQDLGWGSVPKLPTAGVVRQARSTWTNDGMN